MREQGGADVRMVIRPEGAPDPRRYNAPTVPEVAVIMPGDGYGEEVASRDIVLHARTGCLQRITETHRAYDALHYVLHFPLGEDGWQLKNPHARGKGCVTAMEYESYRVMIRSKESPRQTLSSVSCGYVCQDRTADLKYIKINQQKIRVDLYCGLSDAVAAGDTDSRELGSKIIYHLSFDPYAT